MQVDLLWLGGFSAAKTSQVALWQCLPERNETAALFPSIHSLSTESHSSVGIRTEVITRLEPPPVTPQHRDMPSIYTPLHAEHTEPPPQDAPGSRRNASPPRNGSSLGIMGNIILWLGTAVVAIALGFISFLWICAHRAREGQTVPESWLVIVSNGWLPQSITLSSLALRFAIAMQSGLMVAMIAGLAVERFRTSLYRAPEISMMRASGASAIQLCWALTSQPIRGRHGTPALFALAALLVTAASNFASTILLSDMGPGWYSETPKRMPVSVEYADDSRIAAGGGTFFANSRPDTFPVFAEYTEPALELPSVKDTGLTIRALPPFPGKDRINLNYYSGLSLLVDSRVMCFNPGKDLDVEVRLDEHFGLLYVSGVLSIPDMDDRFPLVTFWTDSEGLVFNCSAAVYSAPLADDKRQSLDWSITACNLERFNAGLGTSLDGLEDIDGSRINLLLLNVTGDYSSWSSEMSKSDDPFTKVTDDNEWRRFETPTANVLSITLCMTTFFSTIGDSVMRGHAPRSEPSLDTWVKSAWGYDTSRVLAQYGAVPDRANYTAPERGILTLDKQAIWGNKSYYTGVYEVILREIRPFTGGDHLPNQNVTLVLCTVVDAPAPMAYKIVVIDRALINIVQDILSSTRNPALALQTLFTILVQRAYYDHLALYDSADDAIVAFTPSATLPVRWSGYVAVMSIAAVHLLLLSVLTTIFLRATKISRLGDFWNVFAQSYTDQVRTVFEQVQDVSDANVKEWISENKEQDEARISRTQSRTEPCVLGTAVS